MQARDTRGRADLRKALRHYFYTGDQIAFRSIIADAIQWPGGARPVLYEAYSQALSGDPHWKVDRLPGLVKAIDVQLDAVDRAVMAFCFGDVGEALRAINEAPVTGRHRQRFLLWRAFLENKSALDAGAYASEAPLNIFQFWDKAPPRDVEAAMDEWRDFVGPSSYARFDDASAREVLVDAGIPGLLDAYDSARHPAMKSDIFRLVYLLRNGGLYVDADTRPAPAARNVLGAASRSLHLAFYAHQPHGLLQNAVMLVEPGHPLLPLAIETCIKNVLGGEVERVSIATGPGVVTNAFLTLLEKGAIPATMMAFSECNTRLARNFPASYKGDDRSWHLAARREA